MWHPRGVTHAFHVVAAHPVTGARQECIAHSMDEAESIAARWRADGSEVDIFETSKTQGTDSWTQLRRCTGE